MYTIWILSENAIERESMELFLSQNDFTVRTFSSSAQCPRAGGEETVDALILSPGGDRMLPAEQLSALRDLAKPTRIYLLSEGYSREEIGKLLQIGINGLFNRPLRPLAIIQKLKEDLGPSAGAGAIGKVATGPARTQALSMGVAEMQSAAWQKLSNTILGQDELPPLLFVESPSALIFRFYLDKLRRRVTDAHLVFLDGSEAVIRAGVVAEIEYGQWRRPPVAAIYAHECPRRELLDFFLSDLGLASSGEDALIRLVLGSRHTLAEVVAQGRCSPQTERFLRGASVVLPGGDAFRGDWERLLEFRVLELVASLNAAQRPKVVLPEDLFAEVELSSGLEELEGFAHWLAIRLSLGEWLEEEALREFARHVEVFGAVAPQCFSAEDEVEARAALVDDALASLEKRPDSRRRGTA